MTNTQILNIAKQQHAIDLNCQPEDFSKEENIITISQANKNARSYLIQPLFCYLVSYGKNIVASVDQRIFDLVKGYINTQHINDCFNILKANSLTSEFAKHGHLPCKQLQYWLPDANALKPQPCNYRLQLLENKNLAGLYGPEWSNALSETRPQLDMLGVGAYDGNRLVGLAGCSADCDTMWQIGVDVLPEYRNNGIAAALTSRLAVEVLALGKVPFYCCTWSNLASARNAIKSGFRPAWVELTSLLAEKATEWKA
ncbi:MAG: GNAT family N-acetyltransferase [Defluviitaleaceae bacterium]|nr:GNAT family N-acetyltransferase [Defluviitaleaceae bacterium]